MPVYNIIIALVAASCSETGRRRLRGSRILRAPVGQGARGLQRRSRRARGASGRDEVAKAKPAAQGGKRDAQAPRRRLGDGPFWPERDNLVNVSDESVDRWLEARRLLNLTELPSAGRDEIRTWIEIWLAARTHTWKFRDVRFVSVYKSGSQLVERTMQRSWHDMHHWHANQEPPPVCNFSFVRRCAESKAGIAPKPWVKELRAFLRTSKVINTWDGR